MAKYIEANLSSILKLVLDTKHPILALVPTSTLILEQKTKGKYPTQRYKQNKI